MGTRVRVWQTLATSNIAKNVSDVVDHIQGCTGKDAPKLVVLGEMFSNPYDHSIFKSNAQKVCGVGEIPRPSDSKILSSLSIACARSAVWLVAGTVPEKDETGRVFNTCVVLDDKGTVVHKYRKMHLFDVDVNVDGQRFRFKESETLSPGDSKPSILKTPWGFNIGVGICYDVRFPEYAQALRNSPDGSDMALMIFPSAFAIATGSKHFSLLARARALDCQSYVIMSSVARSTEPGHFQAWGHSLAVNPWGSIIRELDETPGYFDFDVDPKIADQIRQQIPISTQQRYDVYSKCAFKIT